MSSPVLNPHAADPVALAESLRPAMLRLSRRLRQEAQRAGVSALDAQLLGQIKRHPGLGVSHLADGEQISRPAMSGHIKRLEAAGWIARTGDASDGRRSGLAITPVGLKRLEAIRRLRNDWLAARIARLPPEARERLAAAGPALLQLSTLDP